MMLSRASNPIPLISVVMPVYNSEKFLAQAIESILMQTEGDFELLAIYDQSSDASLAIIERYQKLDVRIRLLRGRGKNLIDALNQGIAAARGKFIARMDADDVSLPERFSKQVALLEAQRADICGCHFAMIDIRDRVIQYFTVPTSSEAIRLYFCCRTPFPHPGVMIRRDSILKASLLYGSPRFSAIEDFDLWVRMMASGLFFANVDEILLNYRLHNGSISRQKNAQIRKQSRDLIDSMYRNNRSELRLCFGTIMEQDQIPYADMESAANYVFLEMILSRSFQNAQRLVRKLGLPLFLQFMLSAVMRRLLAAKC